MLNDSDKYELTELLYPAFFSRKPNDGYTSDQLRMMFSNSTREELARSRDLLRAALDAANWDLRAVLPNTPRTDAELREFVSAAIDQIEQLMLTVA
jgi:hypothetical protein